MRWFSNSLVEHYTVLGLPFGAPISKIKSSYLSLAKSLHPDVSTDP